MTTDTPSNDDQFRGNHESQNEDHLISNPSVKLKDHETPNGEPVISELSFYKRLLNEETFRQKFVTFLCLNYSFLMLGFSTGVFGPTLLDLQKITECSLDKASMFFISNTIGYLTSSVLAGLVFEKFNKILQMFAPSFVLTGVTAVIPWCSRYEVMVTVHFCKGFCNGFIDAVGCAILLHIYAKDVKTYMQVLQFIFAFGAFFAPMVAAPFLSKESIEHQMPIIGNTTVRNQRNLTYSYVDLNASSSNVSTMYNGEKSEIYKVYTILAFMTFSSAISFVCLYFRNYEISCPTSKTESEEHKEEHIPLIFKSFVLFVIACTVVCYGAVEDTYAGFLTTFTVKHFKWTKAQGSFATSVFWTSFAIGRFTGIFIINFFKQSRLLRVYSLLMISAFACLLATALTYEGIGVWIASAGSGFAMSIFFPIFFSWTEEKFFHVDGKVTALILVCSMTGVVINPIILGQVMESNPEWFAYIMLIESCMLFIFFSIGVCMSGKMKKYRMAIVKEIRIELDNRLGLLDKTENENEL